MEPSLGEALLRYLTDLTPFQFRGHVLYSGKAPVLTEVNGDYWLMFRDVDWTEVPEAQFVFLLWNGEDISLAWGGSAWALGDYLGTGKRFTPISIPYRHARFLGTFCGFRNFFTYVVVAEWYNSLVSWLNDGLGYNILNVYPNGGQPPECIDCTQFPLSNRYPDCYELALKQLSTDMVQRLSAESLPAPPLPLEPPWPPIPPPSKRSFLLALVATGAVAAIWAWTRRHRRERA